MRLQHGAGHHYSAANARQQRISQLCSFFVNTPLCLGLAVAGASGTVAAGASPIGMGYGWNYQRIKE
jgi:hypothetical protein